MKKYITLIILVSAVVAKAQQLGHVRIDGGFYYIYPKTFSKDMDIKKIAADMDSVSYHYVILTEDSLPAIFINRRRVKGGTGITIVRENGNYAEFRGYKKGKLHNAYYAYYPNGYIKEMGQYKNGIKRAKWIYFNENGVAVKIEKFNKKGEVTKTKSFKIKDKLYNKSITPSEKRSYKMKWK